jgi:transketolase
MTLLNKNLRKRILIKGTEAGQKHFSAAFSCIDIIKYLYDNVLTSEDLFILSKGHGAMALFAVLEEKGKKVPWEFVHPEIDEELGIYATTGSLGHGLPIALGRALAKREKGSKGKVYVLLGDGEIQEGSNWEALILANKLNVNLNLILDWNKYQAVGSIKENMDLDGLSLEKKFKAFGCKNVAIIDGHNEDSLAVFNRLGEGLNAIILDTVKGKGVKFLEEIHPHSMGFEEGSERYLKALEDLS